MRQANDETFSRFTTMATNDVETFLRERGFSDKIMEIFADDLDVFKFLLKKLPTVTAKGFKSKGYDVFSFIMQRRQTGTDVEAFAKTKDVIYAQPFILALGDENGNPTEYFIIVDNTSIPGGTNAVEAFDRLYKVHYVFNVHFAKPVLTFFNFFDGLVYGVSKHIRPTVRELYSQMMQEPQQKEA
ncbi:uncharacterized protein [Amphiura filiformis]|uniref:uncharacterized protein n=1 Tax=Amphiura filiformis TaxID=82378 RepID=UPI003B21B72C